MLNKKQIIGSKTAKDGFLNEKTVCEKFNNWNVDTDAQQWLKIMGYPISNIAKLQAIHIPTKISKNDYAKYGLTQEEYKETIRFKKADAQVQLKIKIGDFLCLENISIKKANVKANYNQIDKRPVSTYQEIWGFNSEIAKWLKLFTGETDPQEVKNELLGITIADKRRLILSEIPNKFSEMIITFFEDNKIMVISDVLRGRGIFSAEWMLVTKQNQKDNVLKWQLVNMNQVINHYAKGNVEISPKGSLKIGLITMQRKGGTPDPTSLQFKFKPLEVFDI